MTLLEEVARLLDELGLGSYDPDGRQGDVFLAVLPPSPDLALALSRQPGRESDARLAYDEPVVRVRVRGNPKNAVIAEARAQAVYDGLHGMGDRALPGGTWLVLSVGTAAGPVFAGRDTGERDEWVVDLRMELHRPTAHRS
jgi:hypothetical protein